MEWSEILENNLKKLLKEQKLIDEFKSLTSTNCRIEFCEKNYKFEIDTFLNRLKQEFGKNDSKLSEDLRKKGNDYYAVNDKQKAFTFYTKSIHNANKTSKPLILGYSNRSAVFYEEKLYNQCLIDIQSVARVYSNTNIDYTIDNFNLIIKLLNREKNCYFYLKKIKELIKIKENENDLIKLLKKFKLNGFENVFNLKINDILKETDESIDKLTEFNNIIDLETSNPILETYSINECLNIQYNGLKGRHCIANRDIQPGESLFIEKSYCFILLPEFNLNYCQRCMKLLYNDIDNSFRYLNIESCNECANVLYCSLECKSLSDASNLNSSVRDCFHKYECNYLTTLLHNLGIGHLAYRCLVSTDLGLIKKYSSIEANNENIFDENLMKIDYRKFSSNDQDLEFEYEQVFNLMTHEKETHVYDLFKYALTSLLLGQIYFKSSDNKHDLINYKLPISSLINRHLLQTICNAHAITQLRDDLKQDNGLTFDREQIRVATALYPRVSLLNHSCNSNVLSSFKPDSSVILVKSSRFISAGSEVYNCYGPHYLKMPLIDRLNSLNEQYRFKCECESCLSQLDSLINNQKSSIGLKCFNCKSKSVKMVYEKINTNQVEDDLIIECFKCLNRSSLRFYKDQFDLALIELNSLNFSSSHSYLVEKIQSLIKKFKTFIHVDENNEIELEGKEICDYFLIFYSNFAKLLDALARVYCNVKSYDKASELVEKCIKILELTYSADDFKLENNVELAHELFKLSEIQCNCKRFEKALQNIDKAIQIARNLYSDQNLILKEFFELRENILKILN